jgi:hypothetical protein
LGAYFHHDGNKGARRKTHFLFLGSVVVRYSRRGERFLSAVWKCNIVDVFIDTRNRIARFAQAVSCVVFQDHLMKSGKV